MKTLNFRYIFAMSTIIILSLLIILFKLNRENKNKIPKSATLVQHNIGSDCNGR